MFGLLEAKNTYLYHLTLMSSISFKSISIINDVLLALDESLNVWFVNIDKLSIEISDIPKLQNYPTHKYIIKIILNL